jgi:hypothetical protein
MTDENKINYAGNGSAEAMKAFESRLINLLEERAQSTADLAAIKDEINSAGFSHRTLKRIASAKVSAANGKPKPLQDLREESGDLSLYLDVLAPERQAAGGVE